MSTRISATKDLIALRETAAYHIGRAFGAEFCASLIGAVGRKRRW